VNIPPNSRVRKTERYSVSRKQEIRYRRIAVGRRVTKKALGVISQNRLRTLADLSIS